MYGPFKREGVPTAPGNQAFDQSLKSRDPAWGVRAFEDVVAAAEQAGLVFCAEFQMPANNLSLIFRRIDHG